MKAKILTFFKYALPLVVAFLLLKFYVFKQISLEEMVREFKQANYYWVGLSGVMLLMAHVCRSHRWNLLLHPLGYRPNLFNTFLAFSYSIHTSSSNSSTLAFNSSFFASNSAIFSS